MDDLSALFERHACHPDCRIIIDSCSDVTLDLARELRVDVIEFPFVIAGEERLDDQFRSMTPAEFYGRMAAGERVLTSAIPTGVFIEVFEECARDGVPTLYLGFTNALSRSILDAQQAAEEVLGRHPGFDLIVMDNCLPALSASLLAVEACRLRDSGASMREVAAWCDANKSRVHGYFTIDSLDWLVAGGRVPKVAAPLSAVLDARVNLTYDLTGALGFCGVSRGRKKAVKNLLKELTRSYDGSAGGCVGITDAACPDDADSLERMVRDELGDACPRILRFPLNPTVGAHVGPGMLAISFWGRDRAQGGRS